MLASYHIRFGTDKIHVVDALLLCIGAAMKRLFEDIGCKISAYRGPRSSTVLGGASKGD